MAGAQFESAGGCHADLAPMVERLPEEQEVPRSILGVGTKGGHDVVIIRL